MIPSIEVGITKVIDHTWNESDYEKESLDSFSRPTRPERNTGVEDEGHSRWSVATEDIGSLLPTPKNESLESQTQEECTTEGRAREKSHIEVRDRKYTPTQNRWLSTGSLKT